jgi:spore germination cell wall hydrolase CwlJ-like protein
LAALQPGRLLIATILCAIVAACGPRHGGWRHDAAGQGPGIAGLLDGAIARVESRMGPGALALASRFDPWPHADLWGRPAAWPVLDLGERPTLGLGPLSAAEAARLNAALPADAADFAPAEPFFLKASGTERARAALCLAQAVYYEAALEPLAGQQAVAQTVINRVRHPDFPKSICGVVYEGSELPLGCQYSFACDGSLARPPIEPFWGRATKVAKAALDGFVAVSVGPATHYHADYVFPDWAPEMVKIVQLGAHIFYRYPGPLGDPATLTARYGGHELAVSMVGPGADAIAAANGAPAPGGATPPGPIPTVATPVVATPQADPVDALVTAALGTTPFAGTASVAAVARVRSRPAPVPRRADGADSPMSTAGADPI